MGKQGSLVIWSCFVILWFGFYTLCLILLLTTASNNDTGKTLEFHHSKKLLKYHSRQESSKSESAPEKGSEHFRNLIDSSPNVKDRFLKNARQYMMSKQTTNNSDLYGFNINLSDKLPVLRPLPDTRPYDCRRRWVIETLPSVSVVSPIFNERLSSLLRHVHALLERTPKEVLQEVILVDDNSTYAFLTSHLENYFQVLDPRIKVVRNKKREGLVRTRMNGARLATGEVIVFLDSHMEVNAGWLEPLLYEMINRGKTTIVQPDVVSIDPHTLHFSNNKNTFFRGGFGWDLRYSWFYKPDYLHQSGTNMADPFPTPVLVGCAVAAWREHFLSTGGFDSGLDIWGGEHFELSFKTWMTGGRIFTVPCSKVGHIFKYGHFLFGQNFPGILRKNLVRVAEVWMDEYKEIFLASQRYGSHLPEFSPLELSSIEERKHLRRRLKSKKFDWFLKLVMPEMRIPTKEAVHYGEIQNSLNGDCISVSSYGFLTLTSRCFKHRILPENQFTIDKDGRFLHDGKCILPSGRNRALRESLCDCVTERGGQWSLTPGPLSGYIRFRTTRNDTYLCAVPQENVGQVLVVLEKCEKSRKDAYWQFQYNFQFPENIKNFRSNYISV